MRYFALNLNTVSPLAIRADHAPGGAESAGYISGMTLTGSLATVHRSYYPEDAENFAQLFLSGQVHYPDLYPAPFKSSVSKDAAIIPVHPLPKTAQTCKRFPGFLHVFQDEKVHWPRHGVRDCLLDWALFELAYKQARGAGRKIEPAVLLTPFKAHKDCTAPDCGNPMEHFTGYYSRSGGHMKIAKSDTRLQTYTGINRETGTVQESILYNRRVFGEHTYFWGLVKVPEHLTTTFERFIGEIGETGLVRAGTGRSRGLGKVHVHIEALGDEQYSFNTFKDRLKKFDTTLQDLANASDVQTDDTRFYFALTLHSPAILCDDLLRYRGTIDTQTLTKELKLTANNFELMYRTASIRRVTGWNEVWGTPRTNEYAIESGSVFLFSSTADPDEDFLKALFRLEEEGIGRRSAEGFGRVCVSDPFHLEVELQ